MEQTTDYLSMSQYRFSLRDFHAVNNADIALDGITVLAGPNGCGKSTVARWLYAYIKYSNQFGQLVTSELIEQLNELIRDMRRALRGFGPLPTIVERQFRSLSKYNHTSRENILCDDEFDYNALRKSVSDKINLFCSILGTHVEDDEPSGALDRWLQRTLFDDFDLDSDFISDFKTRNQKKADRLIEAAEETKRGQSTRKLFEYIRRQLNVSGSIPESINLTENSLGLINGERFVTPFNLRNAVYVDTPVALSNFTTLDNKIWDDFESEMTSQLQPMPATARRIAMRIRRIIGGDIELRKDDLSRSTELRYRRKADNLDIPVSEAATGLKTFAYMLRLVENGWLNGNSLLIIDEPEAHLHPQWIVEFARILVLLNKEVGTKILLASHDPDMVAAIKSISEAEQVSETTRFYQAERADDTFRYDYRDLGNEISEIFSSFNIALERIKDYGR